MKKINTVQVCPKCKTENPLFRLNCSKCSTILHNKIANIDFWKTLTSLIESPATAFTGIIQARKKNFIVFILVFIAIKLFLNALFLKIHLFQINGTGVPNLLYVLIGNIGAFLLLSVGFKYFLQLIKIQIRNADMIAGMVYAQLPLILTIGILFIPEFIYFGPSLFSSNPSIFLISPVFAWLFLVLEAGVLIWTLLLQWKFISMISGKRILSFLLSLIFVLLINGFSLSTIIWLKSIYGN